LRPSVAEGLLKLDKLVLLTVELRKALTCWMPVVLPLSALIRLRMRPAGIILPLVI